MYLFIAIVFFFLLFFFQGKEGYGVKADKEVEVKLSSNAPVTQIEIRSNLNGGDAWINLLDIDVRNMDDKRILYETTTANVFFERGGNWGGLPIEQLWDDEHGRHPSHRTMGHSAHQVDKVIIKLDSTNMILAPEADIKRPPAGNVGSVTIANRFDCCWHRIGYYRLSIFSNGNLLGEVSLSDLAFQGKTIRYKLTRP